MGSIWPSLHDITQCEGKMSQAVRIIAFRMHSPIDIDTILVAYNSTMFSPSFRTPTATISVHCDHGTTQQDEANMCIVDRNASISGKIK